MKTLNYIQNVSVAFSHGVKEKPYESNIDSGINYASMQLPPVVAQTSLAASGVIVDTITDYCKLNYPKSYDRVGIHHHFMGYLHEVPLQQCHF